MYKFKNLPRRTFCPTHGWLTVQNMSIFFKTEMRLGLAADFLIIPLWDLFRDQLCAQWQPQCEGPTAMNTNTELDKCSAQMEAPGSSSQQHRPQSSQITCLGLTLVLEELCASQFLHLEAPWEAGVPLRMFKRKFRNFLNWADTKDQGTWCTCDKIQQLDKGLRITVMLKCCI